MRTFLVQSKNSTVAFDDFSYELIDSCKYQNWFYREECNNVYLTTDGVNAVNIEGYEITVEELMERFHNEIVPVGTIEFVQNIMHKYHNKEYIKPINIPEELDKFEYVRRGIHRAESKEQLLKIMDTLLYSNGAFIKSETECKRGFNGRYTFKEIDNISDVYGIQEDRYIISTLIDIKSEWRVFIYRGEILDCRQYEGEWFDRFDSHFIKETVKAYTNCPPAYTLDVALLKDGKMAVIEVHNFISCGLYGFTSGKHIPQMFERAYKYEITNG